MPEIIGIGLSILLIVVSVVMFVLTVSIPAMIYMHRRDMKKSLVNQQRLIDAIKETTKMQAHFIDVITLKEN